MRPVRIYTTTYCGYCWRAKALLDKLAIPYTEIDCTSDPATRKWLVESTRRRTVPQIFIGDDSIGGCDELHALNRAGKLMEMLKVCA